jgi:hypothetical protein
MDSEVLYAKVSECLIGKQIVLGAKKYGKVIEILYVHDGSSAMFYAVTDMNKRFNAIHLYEFFRKAKGIASQKHYPDGTAFSKYNAGTKAKRIAKAVQMSTPNTIANVRGEQINISSHLTSERVENV